MRKIIFVLVLIIMSLAVFSTSSILNSFTGKANPFNITFIDNNIQSFILPIPNYGYVNNVTLKIKEYNEGVVYQEYPNQNNTDSNYVYINYTKPYGATNNTQWNTKYGNTGYNGLNTTWNFPETCWYNDTNKLVLRLFTHGGGEHQSSGECYNGTTWLEVTYRWAGFSGAGFSSDCGSPNNKTIDGNYATYEFYNPTKSRYCDNYGSTTDIAEYGMWWEEGMLWHLNYTTLKIFNTYYNLSLGQNTNILINTTYLNNLLATYQPLNFTLNLESLRNGTIEVNLTNATYSYLIDNCTNNQGILSNGTALNISFLDFTTQTPLNVNTTIAVDSVTDYVVSYISKNNASICVYPSWYNESATVDIYYTTAGTLSTYTTNTYLSNITQQIKIYVQGTTSDSTILTFKDINTQTVIPNVYVIVERLLGTAWIQVGNGYSDITGKFKFDYIANTRYKFTSSVTGYKDYSFELNPIISSTYDIKLSPSVAETNIPKFYRVTYDFNPKSFKNGLTNFNVTFTSAYGDLTYYGYTLTFPRGGVYYQSSDTGTTPTGSKLTSGNFVINATLPNDYVRIDLFYDTDISPFYNTTLYFTVSAPTVNNTFMNLKDNHYGMGILERTIIALLIVLFVVGLSTLAGQPVFGVALGLFVYGFFVYIGFLPIWSVIISFIIGFLIVAGREAGF